MKRLIERLFTTAMAGPVRVAKLPLISRWIIFMPKGQFIGVGYQVGKPIATLFIDGSSETIILKIRSKSYADDATPAKDLD